MKTTNFLLAIIAFVFVLSLVFYVLLPVTVFLAFIYLIFKNTKKTDVNYTPKNFNVIDKEKRRNKVSLNKEQNSFLKHYFEKNVEIKIGGNYILRLIDKEYKSVDDLYLVRDDEIICKLIEYGNEYPENYYKIINKLKEVNNINFEKENIKQDVQKEKTSKALEFVDELNKLNEQIPNEEISNQLLQSCVYLKRIDNSNTKNKEEKVNKLYNYYLPILLNILNRYKKLHENDLENSEFKKAELELIKKITLINEALKTVCDSLYDNDYLNINADMSVLENLLKKDGLVKGGIEINDK